ncbi:hypothetical protein QBC35DRAFT_132011 [Podospora australis]|uniref:Indole-diterpene biosynthesis protein PaxU n=1 Tax=Podospora australis TaxID=1536484 RepID=A0AAN7ABY7_9PEZI|nr:hypothetical protein QBC35DRAFT_132011 [Podospora australis]
MPSPNSQPPPTQGIRLSPSVTLYNPAPAESASTSSSAHQRRPLSGPRLIILATWAFAQDAHIAKYVSGYQALFPGTTILVAKCFLRHFFFLRTAKEELEPAAAVIRDLFPDSSSSPTQNTTRDTPAELILHIYSNSGLNTAYSLNEVYTSSTSTSESLLPLHATIFDSSPGRYSFSSVAAGVMFGVPPKAYAQRLIALPLAYLLTSCLWMYANVFGGQDWVSFWSKEFNNPERFRESSRVYLYSKGDPLVEWQVVEEHAREAEAKGFVVVGKRDFGEKSRHVAHARTDPGVYWGLVEGCWRGRARL